MLYNKVRHLSHLRDGVESGQIVYGLREAPCAIIRLATCVNVGERVERQISPITWGDLTERTRNSI
jgi:hypothetical protein